MIEGGDGGSRYSHSVEAVARKGRASLPAKVGIPHLFFLSFGTSGRRCSRSPLGDRQATTLVATVFTVIFWCIPFLIPVYTIPDPWIPFLISWIPFLIPWVPFLIPWIPFLIFSVATFTHRRNCICTINICPCTICPSLNIMENIS